jgi:hypothetical protein
VFSKLFSFTLKPFPIVSVKPVRSCTPATKLRPNFTAPKMKRFRILTFIQFGSKRFRSLCNGLNWTKSGRDWQERQGGSGVP